MRDVDDSPTHEFDARFLKDGQLSPLCGIKLWLPIDCHEDVRLQVLASEFSESEEITAVNPSDSLRFLSEVGCGFSVEAEGLHIRSVTTKSGLKVQGTKIVVDHIGELRFTQLLGDNAPAIPEAHEQCTHAVFRLSDLKYGRPEASEIVGYLGNRKIRVLRTRTLRMPLSRRLIKLELHKHWRWHDERYGRRVVGGFPVLEMKGGALRWEQLNDLRTIGRDACLFLTLAARHLVVVHVMTVSSRFRQLEEWASPLRRQRSTTEEEACGPLVDEEQLEDYIESASTRWSRLTDEQKDAVRLAVFSINPFVSSTTEGRFLGMFTALEGLATTWFPNLPSLFKKIEALLAAYPPRVSGLWPITSSTKDGLSAIRNHLAHGDSLRGAKREALLVGVDHLHVWIERVLIAILFPSFRKSPKDWLFRHVNASVSSLPRLRLALQV